MKNFLVWPAVILSIISFMGIFYTGAKILYWAVSNDADLMDMVLGLTIVTGSLAACFGMLLLLF